MNVFRTFGLNDRWPILGTILIFGNLRRIRSRRLRTDIERSSHLGGGCFLPIVVIDQRSVRNPSIPTHGLVGGARGKSRDTGVLTRSRNPSGAFPVTPRHRRQLHRPWQGQFLANRCVISHRSDSAFRRTDAPHVLFFFFVYR